MNKPSTLFRIFLKESPVLVEKAGGLGLFKAVFKLKKSVSKKQQIVYLNRKELLELPHKIDNYITVQQAHQKTGFSESKLRRLCQKEEIEAVKFSGVWLILEDSLHNFIDRKNK